jgi:hypothetical protein
MDVKADEPNKTDRYTLHINSLQYRIDLDCVF